MDRKVKLGFGAGSICSIVFGVLGAVYTVTGALALGADGDSQAVSFLSLGIGCLAGAAVILLLLLVRRSCWQRLLDDGRYLSGRIIDCEPVSSVRLNRRHPYRYVALCRKADGKEQRFKSNSSLRYDDRSLIGKSIKVYISESGTIYYMDVEELLP